MTTFNKSLKQELNKINEMFLLGLLTPQERFSLDFKATKSYNMIIRMATK